MQRLIAAAAEFGCNTEVVDVSGGIFNFVYQFDVMPPGSGCYQFSHSLREKFWASCRRSRTVTSATGSPPKIPSIQEKPFVDHGKPSPPPAGPSRVSPAVRQCPARYPNRAR